MGKLRFAIVGCGKIGTRHAMKIPEVPGAELVDACDIIPERADSIAKKYGCKAYYNIEELLKNTEADYINICTPSGLHPEQSILSLNSGKNVLCEKPMAFRVSDAISMVEAAKKNGKKLYIVKQNRYNPPVKYVYDLIKQGKMGTPLQCIVNVLWNRTQDYYDSDAWRGTKAMEGGTVSSQVSHFVDLMLMFMGPAKRVFSLMDTKFRKIEIENEGAIAVDFANGAIGTLNYTMLTTKKNSEGSVTLIFTEGTVKIGGEFLNEIEYFAVNGIDSYDLGAEKTVANDYGSYRGSASNHDKVFSALVDEHNGINNPETVGRLVTGEEGVDSVKFYESALASHELNKIILLE